MQGGIIDKEALDVSNVAIVEVLRMEKPLRWIPIR